MSISDTPFLLVANLRTLQSYVEMLISIGKIKNESWRLSKVNRINKKAWDKVFRDEGKVWETPEEDMTEIVRLLKNTMSKGF